MIFFSLTEAPLPDPTPTPPNTPKRTRKQTRNRPETKPNGVKRSQNAAKRSRYGPKSSFSGWDGRGVCRGSGGGGVVREKENHYACAERNAKFGACARFFALKTKIDWLKWGWDTSRYVSDTSWHRTSKLLPWHIPPDGFANLGGKQQRRSVVQSPFKISVRHRLGLGRWALGCMVQFHA